MQVVGTVEHLRRDWWERKGLSQRHVQVSLSCCILHFVCVFYVTDSVWGDLEQMEVMQVCCVDISDTWSKSRNTWPHDADAVAAEQCP